MQRRPTKKHRRRERRRAARHGMTLLQWRAYLEARQSGSARRKAWQAKRDQHPADDWATFRQAVR